MDSNEDQQQQHTPPPTSTKTNLKDESLNTPGPKPKMQKLLNDNLTKTETMMDVTPIMQAELLALTSEQIKAAETEGITATTPTPPTTPKAPSAPSSSSNVSVPKSGTIEIAQPSGSNVKPVVLNNKMTFTKLGNQPQTIVKIATTPTISKIATTSGVVTATTVTPTTIGSLTTIGGKTALKTASGQIVYIQKANTVKSNVGGTVVGSGAGASTSTAGVKLTIPLNTANAKAIKTISLAKPNVSTTKPATATTPTTVSVAGGVAASATANKTVAIQIIRSADGKLVPVKTAAAAAAVTKNSPLTLSPNVAMQLAGKKFVTSSGEPVVIKTASALKHPIVTMSSSGLTPLKAAEPMVTTAKPIKIQKIMASAASTTLINSTTTTTTTTTNAIPKIALKAVAASDSTEMEKEKSEESPNVVKKIGGSEGVVKGGGSESTSANNANVVKANATAITTGPSSSTTTTAGGKIVVQSSSGKQIVVPNTHFIKMPQKIATTGAASVPTKTLSTTNVISTLKEKENSGEAKVVGTKSSVPGQLHAIQIQGKQGLHYVRVMAPKKVPNLPGTTSSAGATTPSTATTTTAIVSKTTNSGASTSASAAPSAVSKILNSGQPKFTVVRQNSSGKFILTQSPKNDGNGGTIVTKSPIQTLSPKVQKTIVTLPTVRSISNSNDSPTTSSPIKAQLLFNRTGNNQQQSPSSSTTNTSGVIGRPKPKILDLNTQIQRLTATSNSGGVASGDNTTTKRVVSGPDGKRYVVMSRSSFKPTAGAGAASSTNNTTNTSTTTGQMTPNRIIIGQKTPPSTPHQSSQHQQLTRLSPKVYIKNGSAVGTSDGGMKSFIICKTPLAVASAGGQQVKTIQVKRSMQPMASRPKLLTEDQRDEFELQQQQKRLPIEPRRESHQHQNQQQKQQQQQHHQQQQHQQKLLQKQHEQQQVQLLKDDEENNDLDSNSNNNNNNNNNNNSKFVPVKIKQEPLDGEDSLMYNSDGMVGGGVRRKHCNCSKSQCLKLYCDCFANGEFCQDCTCKDCFNNLQYEDERQRAIRCCLERNPSAFKPKITAAHEQSDTRLHNKGCNCKRSGCLKNYCECFEAKIPCSSNCKCQGCRNIEDRPDFDMDPIDPKLLESITNASNATSTIARAVSSVNRGNISGLYGGGGGGLKRDKRNSGMDDDSGDDEEGYRKIEGIKREIKDEDLLPGSAAFLVTPQLNDDGGAAASGSGDDKRSANFITPEVIDATIQCMISQADECLKKNLSSYQIEQMVLEELGRCLVEIIDFSIRNTDSSFSQN